MKETLTIALLFLGAGLLAQDDISLNGEWFFRVPDGTKGVPTSSFREQPVQVPHTYNVMDGLEDYAGKASYSRSLPVTEAMKNCKLRLHFNGVYHSAVIHVNGRKVGEHLNAGYTPFSFDITPFVDFSADADNELLVECDNSYSQENLPYGSRFDWANDGGIYRDVTLHVSGKRSIRYVHVTPQISLGDSTAVARLDIRLWEKATKKADFSIRIRENRTGRILYKEVRTLPADKNEVFSCEIPCGKVELWHFDNPALYTYEVDLLEKKAVLDRKTERFGFRVFRIDGDQFVLNGEPVRLPGIENMPGSNPDFGMAESHAYMEKSVRRMKDLNCTITRFHWAQDGNRLALMDSLGIFVQEELSWWQGPYKELSPSLMETAKRQLSELIEAHYNHPCIFAWGMSNEVGNNHEHILELAAHTRSLDGTRIVDAVSNGIYSTLDKDPSLVLDLPTWNEYMGTWHGESRNDLLTSMPKVANVLNGRPLLITEHGLCEPTFTGGDARRVDEMIFHIKEWKRQPFICGYIYFSLEDYRTHMGEEGIGRHRIRRHGVCDKYLEPKASYFILQQLMSPIAVTKVSRPRHPGQRTPGPGVVIAVKASDDIPSYTLRGYCLRYETNHGMQKTIALPVLKPGDSFEMLFEDINDNFHFDILRHDGSIVLKY
jgi:beta-glucuronidase